jgi:hypothetical protein
MDALKFCPLWKEVCALRRYKTDAERRLSQLEERLTSRSRDSDLASPPPQRLQESGAAPQPRQADFRRSLGQLREIEVQLSEITSENTKLKATLRRSQEEVCEWHRFASAVMAQICGDVRFSGEFPDDDGPAQRFILSDLLKKLSIRDGDVVGHPEYQRLARDCAAMKVRLGEVTHRCDQMLAIIRSKGYRTDASATRGARHSFGRHAQDIKRDCGRTRGFDDNLGC